MRFVDTQVLLISLLLATIITTVAVQFTGDDDAATATVEVGGAAGPLTNADAAASDAFDTDTLTPTVETAVERRERLMGTVPKTWTPMAPAQRQPQVRTRLLKQVRRKNFVGIYGARPEGYRPVAIVMHTTGSGQVGSEFATLDKLWEFFTEKGVAASHYSVDREGNIMQLVKTSNAAFHVATPGWNGISIGIELHNDNTGSQPFPPAQLEAARNLVRSLGTRFDIPAEAVVRHRDVQPEDRADPPNNFAWDAFIESLK